MTTPPSRLRCACRDTPKTPFRGGKAAWFAMTRGKENGGRGKPLPYEDGDGGPPGAPTPTGNVRPRRRGDLYGRPQAWDRVFREGASPSPTKHRAGPGGAALSATNCAVPRSSDRRGLRRFIGRFGVLKLRVVEDADPYGCSLYASGQSGASGASGFSASGPPEASASAGSPGASVSGVSSSS